MICSKCGKEHDGSFGSGKYCSLSCSKSRNWTQEMRDKQSLISTNLNKHKPKYCKCCGNEILTPNRKLKFCSVYCKTIMGHIPTLIKYFGFDETTIGSNKVFEEYQHIKHMLFNMYWVDKLSSNEICEIFGYPFNSNLTAKIFKYLNIPIKSVAYAIQENIILGRLTLSNIVNTYKCGWHETWNGKKFFLRSSYEFDYARELDEKQIDYSVERLRIKYWDSRKMRYRIAVPDFLLIETNTLVEVKSTYTLEVQEMKDKFKEYKALGYNVKIMLDHKEYELDSLENEKI